MNERYTNVIAGELKLRPGQVQATALLLEEGGTIPFIARYRKEATGSLDEVLIGAIRDRIEQLESLDKRRSAVLKSLEEQGKLSFELHEKILAAETLAVLEDIYLPFRPKRRTRAAIAREKGLEPLAELLFEQRSATDPSAEAERFVSAEKEVLGVDDALAGARDIIAERVNETAGARSSLRELFAGRAVLRTRVVQGKEEEGVRYRDYYDREEPVRSAPSHRILAARRGEKEGILTLHILPPEDEALSILDGLFLKNDSPAAQQVRSATHDSYKRLLAPSLETEIKGEIKLRADREAIRVFSDNLRHLLMAPPLGFKKIMAIDPGFRTGCKIVLLEPHGKLLHNETIFPHSGEQASLKAGDRVRSLVAGHGVEAIAIGNGTAGRETESFIRELGLPKSIPTIMVDESGASIYSASETAREEFPDHDVTVRGSVSIGRRLMDPLAELVKIDPKSIGVGQYQHDVDQGELKKGLDDVVMSCVNAVGVEVNSASPQLLAYVSGLSAQLARNIVAYRQEHGPFGARAELRKVPRLGPRAFEQAAGFLRISNGRNPLDRSAVHPESYPIVERMARDLGCSIADLIGESPLREKIDPSAYVTGEAGLPTLLDILSELAKPGRDPRRSFEAFSFAEGVEKIADLKPGMSLPGIVTNVTAFGAFVDVGVHRDGLVHVSELSDQFVKDPQQFVQVHQKVRVRVVEVDLERGRISLSMKSQPSAGKPEHDSAPSARRQAKDAPPAKKGGFNNPFERAFRKH